MKLTNDISVTCSNVAGDIAIYDSIVTNDNNVTNNNCVTYDTIVTADNNVTHDSDLNDNSLTCHKVVEGATLTNDKKVTRGIALDHNNGTNTSDMSDNNLTCHKSMTVDSVTNDNSVTCPTMTNRLTVDSVTTQKVTCAGMSCDNMTHNCITDTELTQTHDVGHMSSLPRKQSCDNLEDMESSRGGGRGKDWGVNPAPEEEETAWEDMWE